MNPWLVLALVPQSTVSKTEKGRKKVKETYTEMIFYGWFLQKEMVGTAGT